MRPKLSTLFKQIGEKKTKKEKAEFLLSIFNKEIDTILTYAYSPKIKWLLPEGEPPYKPFSDIDQEGRLYAELRKLYLFIEGGNPNLTNVRREHLFIQLLESIDPEDAKLVLQMKDRKLNDCPLAIVKLAFPNNNW
jgi:hypothetical protein